MILQTLLILSKYILLINFIIIKSNQFEIKIQCVIDIQTVSNINITFLYPIMNDDGEDHDWEGSCFVTIC